MPKTDETVITAAPLDPFAGVAPVVADRLTDPKPVEINPAAAALIDESASKGAVLQIEAADDNHLKALVKHLRLAAQHTEHRLMVKANGLTLRFKATPKSAPVEPDETETPEPDGQ